jgi:FAD/FMN-containing dehydrogenase
MPAVTALGRREFLARSAGGALALGLPGAAAAADLLAEPSVSKAALRALRAAVRGPVLFPGTPGYGQARLVYNTRYDGAKPAAVVQPRDAHDVAAVVKWARKHDVRITAKGGGHSYAGYSTIANGVVVDLTLMRGIRVNTASKQATIGAGCQLIDVYSALAAKGVTVPAGSCPSVGVSGHALGGGMGLAGRRFGLLADNLLALTIVTADGAVRTASPKSNPDLYWACRGGGGGNFGIVTSFTFSVHRARSAAFFNVSWPWSAASAAMAAWQGFMPDAPAALTSIFHLATSGGGSPQASANGQFFGSPSALRRLLAPLAGNGGRVQVGSMAYLPLMLYWAGCSHGFRACHTRGTRPGGTLPREAFFAKSQYVSDPVPARGRATMIDWIERRNANPSQGSGALLFDSYGGALNRVRPGATAFVHRDELFCIQYGAYFEGAAAQRASKAWINGAAKAVRPFVSGQAYQNYIDPQLASWANAYYGSNLPRLRAVKKRYDPDFFFRFRQAIPPAA